MSTELVTPEAPVYQCRHIFTDGHRCGSRALRGENFCYYHHQTRKPATGPRLSLTVDPQSPFDLPLPEDRSAIQGAIGLILQRIALNQLDSRRAGLLLYALQIASSNLPKALKNAQPIETVEEITFDEQHGPLAPESELHKPKGEKNLEQILLEQWAKDDELAANTETFNLQATAELVAGSNLTTAPSTSKRISLAKANYPTTKHHGSTWPRSNRTSTCRQAGSAPSKRASPCPLQGPASGTFHTPQQPRHASSAVAPLQPTQSAPRDRLA